jgi:tetratricopeptide (TPR) repeat protein
MQVIELDPVPPRKLDPKIERDLETICLKCLSKSPSHRYPSAIELSADINRFLNDQPILARPPGWLETTNQWARNHVATVVTLMTLLGLSVPFLPTIPFFLDAMQPNQDRKLLNLATPLQLTDSAQARGIEQGMTSLLQTQPENKAARFDKAIALLSQQKYAASIDELSVLANADPQNPELLFTRALANYRLNQIESAKRDLATCIELRPNWPGPSFLRAEIHRSQDSLRAALQDIERAILLHPGQIEGYLLRKDIHERLGNYGAAIIDERMIQSLRSP